MAPKKKAAAKKAAPKTEEAASPRRSTRSTRSAATKQDENIHTTEPEIQKAKAPRGKISKSNAEQPIIEDQEVPESPVKKTRGRKNLAKEAVLEKEKEEEVVEEESVEETMAMNTATMKTRSGRGRKQAKVAGPEELEAVVEEKTTKARITRNKNQAKEVELAEAEDEVEEATSTARQTRRKAPSTAEQPKESKPQTRRSGRNTTRGQLPATAAAESQQDKPTTRRGKKRGAEEDPAPEPEEKKLPEPPKKRTKREAKQTQDPAAPEDPPENTVEQPKQQQQRTRGSRKQEEVVDEDQPQQEPIEEEQTVVAPKKKGRPARKTQQVAQNIEIETTQPKKRITRGTKQLEQAENPQAPDEDVEITEEQTTAPTENDDATAKTETEPIAKGLKARAKAKTVPAPKKSTRKAKKAQPEPEPVPTMEDAVTIESSGDAPQDVRIENQIEPAFGAHDAMEINNPEPQPHTEEREEIENASVGIDVHDDIMGNTIEKSSHKVAEDELPEGKKERENSVGFNGNFSQQMEPKLEASEAQPVETAPESSGNIDEAPAAPDTTEDTEMSRTQEIKSNKREASPDREDDDEETPPVKRLKAQDGSPRDATPLSISTPERHVSSGDKPRLSRPNRKSFPSAMPRQNNNTLAPPQSASRVKNVGTKEVEETRLSPKSLGQSGPDMGRMQEEMEGEQSVTENYLAPETPQGPQNQQPDSSNILDTPSYFHSPIYPREYSIIQNDDNSFNFTADNSVLSASNPSDEEAPESVLPAKLISEPAGTSSEKANVDLTSTPLLSKVVSQGGSGTPQRVHPETPASEEPHQPGEGTMIFDFITKRNVEEFNAEGEETTIEKFEKFKDKLLGSASKKPRDIDGQPQQSTPNAQAPQIESPVFTSEVGDGWLAASTPLMNKKTDGSRSPQINNRLIEGDSLAIHDQDGESSYFHDDDSSANRTQDYGDSFAQDVDSTLPGSEDGKEEGEEEEETETSPVTASQEKRVPFLPSHLTTVSQTPKILASSTDKGTPLPKIVTTPVPATPGLDMESLFGPSPSPAAHINVTNINTPKSRVGQLETPKTNTNDTPSAPNFTPSLLARRANESLLDTPGLVVVEENSIYDEDISALSPGEARTVYKSVQKEKQNDTTPFHTPSPKKRPSRSYKGSQTPQVKPALQKSKPRQSLPAKLTGFHQKLLRSATKTHLPGSPLKQCESADSNTTVGGDVTVTPHRRSSRNIVLTSPIQSAVATPTRRTPKKTSVAIIEEDLQSADESVISELNDVELDWLNNNNDAEGTIPLVVNIPEAVAIGASPFVGRSRAGSGASRSSQRTSTPRLKPDQADSRDCSMDSPTPGQTPNGSDTPSQSAIVATKEPGHVISPDGASSSPVSVDVAHDVTADVTATEEASDTEELISPAVADDENLDPLLQSSSSSSSSSSATVVADLASPILSEVAEEKEGEGGCVLSATVAVREVMSQLDPVPAPKANNKHGRKHEFQNKPPAARHSINTLPTPLPKSLPESDLKKKKASRRNTLSGGFKSENTVPADPNTTELTYLVSPTNAVGRDILIENNVTTTTTTTEEVETDISEGPHLLLQMGQPLSGEQPCHDETENVQNTEARDDFLDKFIASYNAKKAARADGEQKPVEENGSPARTKMNKPTSSPSNQASSPNTNAGDNSASTSSPLRRSPRASAVPESRAQSTVDAVAFNAGQTPKPSSRSQKISSLPVLSGKSKHGQSKGSKHKTSVISAPPPFLDLSVLVSPAPGEPPTLSQLAPRELAKITAKNTTVNALWENVTFEREVVQRDIPRPPSPNGKRQTAQAIALRKRRKAIEEETGIVLGPGDELDFVPQQFSPSRKRVKWGGQLESGRDEELPRASPKQVRGQPRRSVLRETKVVSGLEKSSELSTIKVVRYLYLGEKDEYS